MKASSDRHPLGKYHTQETTEPTSKNWGKKKKTEGKNTSKEWGHTHTHATARVSATGDLIRIATEHIGHSLIWLKYVHCLNHPPPPQRPPLHITHSPLHTHMCRQGYNKWIVVHRRTPFKLCYCSMKSSFGISLTHSVCVGLNICISLMYHLSLFSLFFFLFFSVSKKQAPKS